MCQLTQSVMAQTFLQGMRNNMCSSYWNTGVSRRENKVFDPQA